MNRTQLLEAVKRVLLAVDSRPARPEMGCLYFKDDVVIGFNGLIGARAKLSEPLGFDVLVPAEKFVKLLTDLPTDDIEIQLTEEQLEIKAGSLKATYATAGYDTATHTSIEWPDLAGAPAPPEDFLEGLLMCKFTVSNNVAKGTLCGINVENNQIITSDGYRVASFHSKEKLTDEQVVIPSTLISLLSGKITNWLVTDKNVWFAMEDGLVAGGVPLVGGYPDVKPFLEQVSSLTKKIEFPAETLATIKLHADQMGDIIDADREVKVKISEDQISFTSTDGASWNVERLLKLGRKIDAELTFSIHPQFLTDILSKTSEMLCEPGNNIAAFRKDSFVYITGIEWA